MTHADLTHADLVQRAVRWLKNTRRCDVALGEPVSWVAGEMPDAIGWRMGESIIIECKVSVGDFVSDRYKAWRHKRETPGWVRRPHQRRGLGRYRYYLAAPGIIAPERLPPKWGLLACHRRQIRVVREAQRWHVVNAVGECDILAKRWTRVSPTWQAATEMLAQARRLKETDHAHTG